MKKFFLLTLLAICSLNVNAENHRIYAILAYTFSFDGEATIMDESIHTSVMRGDNVTWRKQGLKDENGELLKFNNFLPLIGYMQTKGWVFPDLENQLLSARSKILDTQIFTFLMYREATEAEWLEWIERGKRKKK
ncbi:MAG: hypothetical protein ACI3YC_07130 [Alloprevotella sp.]